MCKSMNRLNSIVPGSTVRMYVSNSRLYSGIRLILLSALLGLGLAGTTRADEQCGVQTVVGGPIVAFYFDPTDKLIAAELVSVMRSIKPSSRSGLKLIAKAAPLPVPTPGEFQAAGAAATAVYVQNSRADTTRNYEYNSIVAVEDMTGVADRQFVPIDPVVDGACRCSKIPCPQGLCCPKQCM